MRLEFLFILSVFARLSSQSGVPAREHCYQKDVAPVDVDLVFDSTCEDDQGNTYYVNSTLQSCCDCFRFLLLSSAHQT